MHNNATRGFTASLVTPQECSAEYSETKHGFTLIELLVVVLIIGILSAVALPQYQAAVDRTTVNAYTSMLNKYVQAQELYYIENGEYAREFNALDVDFSNLCPSKYHNMLFGCKGPVYIDLAWDGKKVTGCLYFSFFPSFGQTRRSLIIRSVYVILRQIFIGISHIMMKKARV